jgi:hypothetical protein
MNQALKTALEHLRRYRKMDYWTYMGTQEG